MLILFGKNGQVALEVTLAAAQRQLPLQALSSEEADFGNPDRIIEILNAAPAGATVINAAAYTQVDQAEADEPTASQINAITPGIIARTCRERRFRLIHISTDYVFSGEESGPYSEDDPTQPIGAYGRTKLAGEQRILEELPQSIILRTSWVFSSHGKNFVKTMLRLGSQRSEISVVADQFGGPTSAASIARTCLDLADQIKALSDSSPQWGLYHYCGTPATTWHGFAEEIFRQAKLNMQVKPIATSEYPTPARRPANSQLNCGKLKQMFGISQPDWKYDLAEVIRQLQTVEPHT